MKFVGVDVAEKAPFWLQLTANGQPGHGSRPIADSAPNGLIRAMAKIIAYEPPIKLLPAVEKLLPDENPKDFLAELKKIIADPLIKIENVNTFKPPNSSPLDTELFRVITRVTKVHHPEALITTKMLSGYTESQLYRQLGIVSYGWAPIYTTVEENEGVHGNNERITVKNVREGTREFYEVVSEIAR